MFGLVLLDCFIRENDWKYGIKQQGGNGEDLHVSETYSKQWGWEHNHLCPEHLKSPPLSPFLCIVISLIYSKITWLNFLESFKLTWFSAKGWRRVPFISLCCMFSFVKGQWQLPLGCSTFFFKAWLFFLNFTFFPFLTTFPLQRYEIKYQGRENSYSGKYFHFLSSQN